MSGRLARIARRTGARARRLWGAQHPPAPFIVGSPRSGTTLLRMMLDAHPQLTVLPETHFLPELVAACEAGATAEEAAAVVAGHRRWGDFHLDQDELAARMAQAGAQPSASGALRAFYELYAESQGKPRWGDKTPEYALLMADIEGLLPEARFIHVIRDGRDAALSRIRWRLQRTGEPANVARLARRWKRWIRRARRQGSQVAHYTEVRYEDLILDTEATLRSLCEFLALDWDAAILDYHSKASQRLEEIAHELPANADRRSLAADQRLAKHEMTTKPPSPDRVAVWRTEMEADDRERFEGVAGDLLTELGYPLGG
jgi:Sulfotransferase family